MFVVLAVVMLVSITIISYDISDSVVLVTVVGDDYHCNGEDNITVIVSHAYLNDNDEVGLSYLMHQLGKWII